MKTIPGWKRARIYSIGHSTRPFDEFVEVLHAHDIAMLADVRTMPGSKHVPQFDKEHLERALPEARIWYRHLPLLGGLRHGRKDSPNTGWHNASFRSYADYMATEAFAEGIEQLRHLAQHGPLALMCAEAVPWRCHRSLIADALYARGVVVRDIMSATNAPVHRPMPFARFDGLQVSYPPPEEEQGDARA